MSETGTLIAELNRTASEIKEFDEDLAEEVSEVSNSLKIASLINPEDRVVCVNPVQGVYKGRIYLVDEYLEPGVLIIKETDGSPVGAFRADRFVLDNKEY